jgi:hypothetical protein
MAQGGHTFELLRGVESIDLTDGVNYTLTGFDGLGASPVHRLTQRGPLQDGQSDVGFRLDPRAITLAGVMHGNYTTLNQNRAALVGFCRPSTSTNPLKLRWTTPDGLQRQIDVHAVGELGLPSNDWKVFSHRFAVQLIAHDPTFYDPAGGSVQFAQTGGGTAMPVPILFPLTFGASVLDVTEVVTLSGANAWDTYPIIYATGPVTGLILTNNTTGDVLDFTGSSIGSGVTYTIDLRYGAKTVVDSSSVNRIGQLTAASDLATWRLVPGNNSITAEGTSISAATDILIQYNQRFIGV